MAGLYICTGKLHLLVSYLPNCFWRSM